MEKRFAVELVDMAVEQIENSGEAAFKDLRDPAGEFLSKDTYVFVIGPDGKNLVDPAFPSLEGTDLLSSKDAGGKEAFKEMMETVKADGSGWVDYMWPKPGDYISVMKSSYVKKAVLGDKWFLVGCGVYTGSAPAERSSALKMNTSQVIRVVADAAKLLEEKGENAFPEFKKEVERWEAGDTYIFVDTPEGVEVVNGGFPSVEGKNILDFRDANGKYLTRECIDMALKHGAGWVDYFWPKPGEAKPSKKHTYVKKVEYGDEIFIVACGAYF